MSRHQRMKEVDRLRQEARFYGEPVPADDANPADILIEELSRTAGAVRWIGNEISKWAPELIDLQFENVDDKGSMQVAPKNEALWLDLYQRERKHLAYVAKLCADIGVSERQIALAEKQAEIMFAIINEAFTQLGLTSEQQKRVPQIMPALIRRIAIPGEVVGHAPDVE